MAATKYQKRLAEYNQQEEEARIKYLERTGKKIARGFKDTEEYKRINTNRKQFLYRYERRKVVNELKEKKRNDNWLKSTTIADKEIFHLVLGYNDKVSRAVRNAFKIIKKQGAAIGRRAVVDITFPEPENNPETRVYESEVKVDIALVKMYQMGLQRQKDHGSDSLLITATQTEGKEGFYFIIVGEYA